MEKRSSKKEWVYHSVVGPHVRHSSLGKMVDTPKPVNRIGETRRKRSRDFTRTIVVLTPLVTGVVASDYDMLRVLTTEKSRGERVHVEY